MGLVGKFFSYFVNFFIRKVCVCCFLVDMEIGLV